MEDQRYAFEKIPEEERFWFIARWPLVWPGSRALEMDVAIKDERGEERAFEAPTDAEEAEMDRFVERQYEVGYVPTALRIPWWLEVQGKYIHEEGREYVEAPPLYSTRERVEAEFREMEGGEPDDYLSLRERYGETLTDAAFDDAEPLRVLWVDRGTLLDKLEDSDFLCVMVDGVLKLRRDLMEELRRTIETS